MREKSVHKIVLKTRINEQGIELNTINVDTTVETLIIMHSYAIFNLLLSSLHPLGSNDMPEYWFQMILYD